MTKGIGIVAAVGFVLTVWLANYAVKHWGFVSVGFGLMAPAGVYFVGLAFTLRDVVHRTLGRMPVIGCIVAGAILSLLVNANAQLGGPVSLAVGSAIAFLVSEGCDLAVYEPVRTKGWLPAILASNATGIIVDSMLFLWLVFGTLDAFQGQVVGKAWMTLLAIPVVWFLRRITPKGVTVA